MPVSALVESHPLAQTGALDYPSESGRTERTGTRAEEGDSAGMESTGGTKRERLMFLPMVVFASSSIGAGLGLTRLDLTLNGQWSSEAASIDESAA